MESKELTLGELMGKTHAELASMLSSETERNQKVIQQAMTFMIMADGWLGKTHGEVHGTQTAVGIGIGE